MLSKRIKPNTIIIDHIFRLFDLINSHFLNNFFLADRSIRITTNGRQNVPHVSAYQIRRRHTQAKFIIPTNTRLCTRMTFQCRAQVPVKSSLVVLPNTCLLYTSDAADEW